jgi:hypothetical protein
MRSRVLNCPIAGITGRFILFIFTSVPLLLSATVYRVGSGCDFPRINEAIAYASEGDSIEVQPGVYHEMVDFMGKSLAIYSLAITERDTAYISSTVIDPAYTGGAVKVLDVASAYLGGFRICHGTGTPRSIQAVGGGIYAERSSLTVESCWVDHNVAGVGGGFYAIGCRIRLIGNTFTRNSAAIFGGGVNILEPMTETDIVDPVHGVFDAEHKNSIYCNAAMGGSDLYIGQYPDLSVHLAKMTLSIGDGLTDHHFICVRESENFEITTEATVIEPVTADLYVSPGGSDSNSGLTAVEPLRSIGWAVWKSRGDSLNPHVIHVAPGTYSTSGTDESLPWSLQPDVEIVGGEGVTVDCESQYNIAGYIHGDISNPSHDVKGGIGLTGMAFRNVSTRGSAAIWMQSMQSASLRDIEIDITRDATEFTGTTRGHILAQDCHTMTIDNVRFTNFEAAGLSTYLGNISRLLMNRFYETGSQVGVGFNFWHAWGPSTMVVTNSAIVANVSHDSFAGRTCCGFDVTGDNTCANPDDFRLVMINCTVSDNQTFDSFAQVDGCLRAEFINCILAANDPNTLLLRDDSKPGIAYFSHCLFNNGVDDISYYGSTYELVTDTVLSGDPLFTMSESARYTLLSNSPAINQGTLNLPEGIELPMTDLAGNPRVAGAGIDIGAYEWNGVSEEDTPQPGSISGLRMYPNPCRNGATIRFSQACKGLTDVGIYNILGQRVRTLIHENTPSGERELVWDGRDDAGRQLGSGVFLVRTFRGGDIAVGKLVLMR